MSTVLYLGLALFGWIIFEVYLQWMNYKGRFRYKLLEGNKWKRSLQNKVGILSLPISSSIKFGIMLSLIVITKLIFNLSDDVAFVSVISGFLGLTITNASFDKYSVEVFEKHCIRCDHKVDCSDFLDKNCTMKFLKHRVRIAVDCYGQLIRNETTTNQLEAD